MTSVESARNSPPRSTAPRMSPPAAEQECTRRRRARGPASAAHADAPVFHITELSHVLNPSGDRPGRPVRTPENDRRRGRSAARTPRLGEMISQLAATGVRVPGGFATTAHAFREFLTHGGLAAAHQRAAGDAGHRRRARAGRGRRRDPPAGSIDTPFPADLERRSAPQFETLTRGNPGASLRGALVGHRRRPARRVVRRPAGDLPERASASTTCCTR